MATNNLVCTIFLLLKINERHFLPIYTLGAMCLLSKSKYAFLVSHNTDPNSTISAMTCMGLVKFMTKFKDQIKDSPGILG